MSGIAGIVIFKPINAAEGIVKRMSNAIQHRGDETLYQYVHPKVSFCKSWVSVRSLRQDAIFVDSKPEHLHILETSALSTGITSNRFTLNPEIYNTLIVKTDSSGVQIVRSVDGTRGLYYTKIDGALFFSSERKSIWAIGQNQTELLEPGHTLFVTWEGKQNIIRPSGVSRPIIDKSIDPFTAIKNLEKELNASFNGLKAIDKCAVLFSGGVDSALAALLTKKYCRNSFLISAVCEGSHDEAAAVKAAELIEAKSIVVKIESEALWDALPEVIYSIETSKRMHVEIALPFFFAAREARRRKVDLVVSGQGPDELFAGYARHERLMKEQGPEAVEDALWKEVSVTHEMNIQRDVRAVAAHGLEVFFPYMYPPFVRLAMSVPATLKMDLQSIPSRKTIFRELAKDLGVSNEIATAPKRATQYSSGITKLLDATIRDRMEGVEKIGKRDMSSLIQSALDTIAAYLQMPVARKGKISKIDLKPTRRLMKRVGISTPSD
jgi:asparagine synthetase B (glutamine-hydrolysing)